MPKRILTEEEMSALSDRLMQVTKGMTITVRYFKEDTAHPEIPAVGNYITLTGKRTASTRCSAPCKWAKP